MTRSGLGSRSAALTLARKENDTHEDDEVDMTQAGYKGKYKRNKPVLKSKPPTDSDSMLPMQFENLTHCYCHGLPCTSESD